MLNKSFITAVVLFVMFNINSFGQQRTYYLDNLVQKKNNDGQIGYYESETGNLLDGEYKILTSYYSKEYASVYFEEGVKKGKEIHYKDGFRTYECFYKNGMLEGLLEEFDSEGNVIRKVLYVQDKMEGKDIYYSSEGTIRREVNYKNGVQDGREVTYNSESGEVEMEANYKNGVLDGNQLRKDWSNQAGDFIIKSVYKNGILQDYKEYYSTGELLKKKVFIAGGDKSIDYSYRIDGSLLSECAYDGTYLDGKQVYYYPNGAKEVEFFCTKNYKNGLRTEYYVDGKVKSVYHYVDGLMDGVAMTYYPEGQIQSEWYYNQNNKKGPYKIYYDNGQIREEGELDDSYSYYGPNYVYQKIYYKSGMLNSYSVNCDGIMTLVESYTEDGKQL